MNAWFFCAALCVNPCHFWPSREKIKARGQQLWICDDLEEPWSGIVFGSKQSHRSRLHGL